MKLQTERPRLNLCARCVTLRGFEGNGTVCRVAVDMTIVGACDDCGDRAELEAWRALDVPEPTPTLPVIVDLTEERNDDK